MVVGAIQTHPLRAEMASALRDRLNAESAIQFSLAVDPEPDAHRSAWRTYRHALESLPADATGLLIVQDDAEPCPNFAEAARRALEAQPDSIVAFFVAGNPRMSARRVCEACTRGLQWAELPREHWVPVVALAWPARLVRPLLDYVDAQSWPAKFLADDEIVGRFVRHAQERVLATAPSLVEHPDYVPSLLGRRARGGADPSRVAGCYIGNGCDALSIDWSLGP